MRNIHYSKKTRSFFEGWYLKHDNGKNSIAFIPSVHFDKNCIAKAFIQIITESGSYTADFEFKDFFAAKKKFEIKIGNNKFSESGISVDINLPRFTCRGKIYYGRFTPLKYNIMGPFSIVPKMECNHGILSLTHRLSGSLNINGKEIDFNNGYGYIERDWGKSFPKTYTWLHFKEDGSENTISVSIADIPFLKMNFRGLIAVVYENGKEYRLATYNGGKVIYKRKFIGIYGLRLPFCVSRVREVHSVHVKTATVARLCRDFPFAKYALKNISDDEIIIKKRKYVLKIFPDCSEGQPLKAPVLGDMARTIKENIACLVKVEFYKGKKCIFKRISNRTSFERVY